MRPTLTSKSDRSGNDLSQRVGAGADGLKGLTRKSLREKTCALVAQLDRASDFESEGREFESLRARHFGTELGTPKPAVFALEAATSVRSSSLFDAMMRNSSASTLTRWASTRS